MDSNTLPTIVIPAAGRSQRFADVGFTIPKPYIPLFGKTMIEHVVRVLPGKWPVVIVARSEDREHAAPVAERLDAKVVYLNRETSGQAHSVYWYARDHTGPFLVVNCDNVITIEWTRWWGMVRNAGFPLAGSIIVTPSNNPAFSYAVVDEHMRVLRTAEKRVISSFACAGAFYYASTVDFINAFFTTVKVNNEYYCSEVYNQLRGAIMAFGASKDEVIGLGTPKEVIENVDRLSDLWR